MKIAIIGLGYVGLPLSLQFVRAEGISVLGLDVDRAKVETLNAGQSYIRHVESKVIDDALHSGRFEASTDFSRAREAQAIIICVPTPLNKNREPDLSFVVNTGRAVAPYLSKGVLVVLESTTYPGTTEEELLPILEAGSGLRAGSDFHLAYSPEREDPGRQHGGFDLIPKVVGGYTQASLEAVKSLYGRIVKKLVPLSSLRAAEATKLLENIFRSVNIALVNELKLVYEAMGIDIWEVIEAAKSKPFGFMAFSPGPGLGGHCIPIDPFYLTWKAREFGKRTRFIELAGEINTAMPAHVVERVAEALNSVRKPVNGSKVLVVGLAYKPEIDDERESPSYVLMDLLTARGAQVAFFDPYILTVPRTREHLRWAGLRSVAWDRQTIQGFDAIVIATNHRSINYAELAEWSPCIVDTRNAMTEVPTKPGQVWRA